MNMPPHLVNFKVIGIVPEDRADQLIAIMDKLGFTCSLGTAGWRNGQKAIRIRLHFDQCGDCDEPTTTYLRGMVEMFVRLVEVGVLPPIPPH